MKAYQKIEMYSGERKALNSFVDLGNPAAVQEIQGLSTEVHYLLLAEPMTIETLKMAHLHGTQLNQPLAWA